MALMKKCEMCGEMHPISDFSRLGFAYSICKQCESSSLSSKEVGLLIGVHESTISRLIREYDIKTARCGRRLLMGNNEVDRLKNLLENKAKRTPVRSVENIDATAQETKICPRCGRTLPLSNFYTDPSKKSGYASYCKDCKTKYSASQREATKRAKLSESFGSRNKLFYEQVMEYKQDFPLEMLVDFYKYWSQSSPDSPTLMLFEVEKTWRTRNRLLIWDSCCKGNLAHLDLFFPTDNIPSTFRNMLKKSEQKPTSPTPPKVEPTPPPPPTHKEEQPVEQVTYSPQTLTFRFKAGDKVVRLKDGIFLLEQLSGKVQVNMGEKPEILYETTDLDMVADKDLFKNKREALERTKLAGIPEERLTYGNKPIK